jgi:AmiR/NasT family two-component response regulator
MFTGQQQQQQQGANAVSSKELAYITDSLKNEDLLAKLALQGVVEAQTPQLKQKFTQIAQDRLQNSDQLLRALQQQTQWTH